MLDYADPLFPDQVAHSCSGAAWPASLASNLCSPETSDASNFQRFIWIPATNIMFVTTCVHCCDKHDVWNNNERMFVPVKPGGEKRLIGRFVCCLIISLKDFKARYCCVLFLPQTQTSSCTDTSWNMWLVSISRLGCRSSSSIKTFRHDQRTHDLKTCFYSFYSSFQM